MMAMLPVTKRIGYHLFELEDGGSSRLLRKSEWKVEQEGIRADFFLFIRLNTGNGILPSLR